MISSISTLFLALTLTLPSTQAAGTVVPDVRSAAAMAISGQADAATPPQTASPTGLPQRAPVARTMAEFWPVFAGFVLTWLVIVGYLLTMGRRISRVADSINVVVEDTNQ